VNWQWTKFGLRTKPTANPLAARVPAALAGTF
jgi:hypothetical protein